MFSRCLRALTDYFPQGTQDPPATLPHAEPLPYTGSPVGSQLGFDAAAGAEEEADDGVAQGSDDWHPLPDFDENLNIIPT